MELRVLEYFLAVTREQSISGAAEALYLSQPTLSRQLRELEEELGKTLFIRGNRRIALTEEGMLLRRRAEEILELVRKTENEISLSDDLPAGEITIGTGETHGVRLLASAAKELQRQSPLVRFHIVSGDRATVTEELDKGLLDFGLVFGEIDGTKYEYIRLPYRDLWGVIMRRDSDLAQKDKITAEDLLSKPLIMSRQAFSNFEFREFFPCDPEKLNIVATYNLIFNGSLMVDEGMGYAITLDRLINVSGHSNLCFRPLEPALEASMSLVWKKYHVLSRASDRFLQIFRRQLNP